jgi:hypothetical protein
VTYFAAINRTLISVMMVTGFHTYFPRTGLGRPFRLPVCACMQSRVLLQPHAFRCCPLSCLTRLLCRSIHGQVTSKGLLPISITHGSGADLPPAGLDSDAPCFVAEVRFRAVLMEPPCFFFHFGSC